MYVNKESVASLGQIMNLARDRGILVKQVNEQKLSQMAMGGAHQGVIATGGCAEYVSVSDILDIARSKGEDPFIIICDEIEDPHNLGAIIRTAESAGAHGIIIPKRRSASLNHTVYKTSAGSCELAAGGEGCQIFRLPSMSLSRAECGFTEQTRPARDTIRRTSPEL